MRKLAALGALSAIAVAVLDRYPELKSLDELPAHAFFWALTWPVGGKRLNLSTIESKYVSAFGDARVHFALASASEGGPALEATPYMPDTLSGQLNDAGR